MTHPHTLQEQAEAEYRDAILKHLAGMNATQLHAAIVGAKLAFVAGAGALRSPTPEAALKVLADLQSDAYDIALSQCTNPANPAEEN